VRVLRVAAVVALVSTTLVSAWASAAGATTVSAEEYVQTVCDGIGRLADLADQAGTSVNESATAYAAQPSQVTATALRQALTAFLDQAAQVVDQATETARAAGAPDVAHGAQFAAAIVKYFGQEAAALRAIATQAAAIDVGSASKFAADYKGVNKKINAADARLRKASKRDPAFKNVPTPLRPLAIFMTTDAARCPL
jgi:hypothetical protein